MLYIDYSSKRLFEFCPWAWFERYVNKRKARGFEGQRNDPLTLGSLVHKGLEAWYTNQNPSEAIWGLIPQLNPTRECIGEAETLVANYFATYPQELWIPQLFEAPLRRQLFQNCELVAKIDGSFSLSEQLQIPGGWQGEGIELEPGVYGLEHKTKDANIDKGLYVKGWQTNLQAAFQLLALQAHFENVRGVLVNVLEKPRPYIPKCVCKNCKTLLERATYVATAKGHMCPVCGVEQTLSALKGPKVERKYECWRFLVQREQVQLEQSLKEIFDTALEMKDAAEFGGMLSLTPNRDNCVTASRGKTCEYFTPHLYNTSTTDNSDFQDAEDYVGEGRFGYVPQILLDIQPAGVVE